MFNEKRCLENLKHIVSEYADEENLKDLPLGELRSTYTQLAGNLYHISVSNRLKYKNMLWNMDHLKPEIRSKFQEQLFKTWHSVYIKSIQTDQINDRPNSKKKASSSLTTVEKHPEIDAQKQFRLTASKASGHQFENDWFDKLLDFFAAIVGCLSGMTGR